MQCQEKTRIWTNQEQLVFLTSHRRSIIKLQWTHRQRLRSIHLQMMIQSTRWNSKSLFELVIQWRWVLIRTKMWQQVTKISESRQDTLSAILATQTFQVAPILTLLCSTIWTTSRWWVSTWSRRIRWVWARWVNLSWTRASMASIWCRLRKHCSLGRIKLNNSLVTSRS